MGAALSENSSTENTTANNESEDSEAEQLLAAAATQDSSDTEQSINWQALAKKAQADSDRWKSLARKHEDRAKTNAEAASKAKTVEEQLAELNKKLTERDAADLTRSGRLAVTQVQANLASSGFKPDDVAGLLDLIDPSVLLTDGEPDKAAIDKLTKSLIKVGGRVTPDPDQGRKGGTGTDMNSVIRRAAGYQS